MCWNKQVSLNTFIFSFGVLLLIIYNNLFTQYKIKELNNFWIYIFLSSIIFVQLLEYFIWNNMNNPFFNQLFTTLVLLLTLLQPVFAIILITNKKIRENMLSFYTFTAIPFVIYLFYTTKLESVVSPLGHLQWGIQKNKSSRIMNYFSYLFLLVWLFGLLYPLFYIKNYFLLLLGILTLLVSMYYYYKDNSNRSLWCWLTNMVSIYYACYLLFYLPFLK
jgi:hypothetical protein